MVALPSRMDAQADTPVLQPCTTLLPPLSRILYLTMGPRPHPPPNLVSFQRPKPPPTHLLLHCHLPCRAAHYNSSLVRRDASIAALLPTAMRQPHAYLVGSFAEASGESAATLAGALALLHDSPLAFRLRLACVDAANTDPATGGPRAINLVLRCAPPTASADAAGGSGAGRHEGATEAVEEAAGQAAAAWEALAALPGVGEPSPTGFEDRGPEMSWRLVRGSVEVRDGAGSGSGSGSGDDSDADEADGENEGEENTERGHSRDRGAGSSTAPRRGSLCPIVETATGRLRIPGHRVRRLAGQHLLYYSRLVRAWRVVRVPLSVHITRCQWLPTACQAFN